MKKISYITYLFAAISLVFSSCNKNEDAMFYYAQVYIIGDILPHNGKTIRILTDGQDTVILTNSERFLEAIKDYSRVYTKGELISSTKVGDSNIREVRAKYMSEIRIIKPSLSTVIDIDPDLSNKKEDGILNIDNAYILSKYLNIEYTRWYNDDDFKKHDMYLVVNDSDGFPAVEDGLLKLSTELRHRANGDKPVNVGKYILSVDIEEYMKMADVNSIVIDIKYRKRDNSYETVKEIKWKK